MNEDLSPSKAFKRFTELSERELLARTAQHGEPLTPAEHLELLAAGALVARYARHPAHVHDAAKAGTAWADIAKALGVSEDQAREDYRQWAHGQHRLFDGGLFVKAGDIRFGLDDVEYTEALARADV